MDVEALANRMFVSWQASCETTTTADPDGPPRWFWLDIARRIAEHTQEWRFTKNGTHATLSKEEWARLNAMQELSKEDLNRYDTFVAARNALILLFKRELRKELHALSEQTVRRILDQLNIALSVYMECQSVGGITGAGVDDLESA